MQKIQTVSLFSVLFLMLSGDYTYAAGGQHLDPLRAISGRSYKSAPVKKRVRTKSPVRHYSPLDALNGKIVVKDAPSGKSRETKKTANKKAVMPQASSPKVIYLDVQPQTVQDTHDEKSTETIEGMILPPENGEVVVTSPHTSDTPAQQQETVSPKKVKITVREPDSEMLTEEQLKALMQTPLERVKPTKKTYHTPTEKTVYLTFDDGPVNGTQKLLRVLDEEKVEATMFFIGREVVRNPKVFQKALAMPNILVANHTFKHANNHYRRFYNSSVSSVVADINKAQKAIGGAKYMRLCGRNVWRTPSVKRNDWGISVAQRGREIPKYDALYNRGYFIYGWDVEWAFSHKTQRPLFNGEEMARRVNLKYAGGHTLKPGKVILLAHDFMFRSSYNAQQLRTFIRIMKAQGWHFKTIDDYSKETPEVYVAKKKQRSPALKSAQKLAQKAKILIPENQPEIVTASVVDGIQNVAGALSEAIRKQSFVRIRRLLARKDVDINGQDLHGDIPLNLAIQTNNAVLVRMLVERGARIFNMDANGMSPMGIAREQNNAIIIRYLKHQIKLQKERRLRQTVFASNESIVNQ